MATLVAATENDQFVEFARFVAQIAADNEDAASQWSAEASDLITAGKYQEFFDKIVTLQNKILASIDEKDAEALFYVYFAILNHLDEASYPHAVDRIAQELIANTADKPALRSKLLANLYNSVEAGSSSRFNVFMHLLKYTGATGRLDLLKHILTNIDRWVKEWNCTKQQTAEIYLAIADMLKQANNIQELEFLQKYLALFAQDEASQAAILDVAKRAAITAIAQPQIFRMDYISELPAMHAFAKSGGDNATLVRLLQVFTTESLTGLMSFLEQHKGFIISIGLTEEACISKMRLLSLASIGTNSKVPYATIAQTLQVPEADVEQWVIRAISARLIEAQMDQLNQHVTITRSTARVFGAEQWQVLADKLTKWREDISGLLQIVRDVRAQQRA